MPAKKVATREEILNGAVDILRREGYAAINARRIAKELHCSTQPIYNSFSNMEELKGALLVKCNEIYEGYLQREVKTGEYPPYKCYGMGYIRFAAQEREIFRFLFMRERMREEVKDEKENLRPIIELIMQTTGLTFDNAYLFHVEMWIFVHGLATQIATGYLPWDFDTLSEFINDVFFGLKGRWIGKSERE